MKLEAAEKGIMDFKKPTSPRVLGIIIRISDKNKSETRIFLRREISSVSGKIHPFKTDLSFTVKSFVVVPPEKTCILGLGRFRESPYFTFSFLQTIHKPMRIPVFPCTPFALGVVIFVCCGSLFPQFSHAQNDVKLPRDASVCILKTGEEPAQIIVIRRGRQWVLTEKTIDRAPESCIPYLQSLFGKEKGDSPPEEPEISYRIDESAKDVPGIEEWAQKSVEICRTWYPKLDSYLATEGFKPSRKVEILFKKMDGVAYSTGNSIVISSDWITKQPEDWGMVVHELVHIIQGYRRGGPGWITEGIADYIRHAQFEPDAPMRRFNPDRAKYTDAYQITAAFFMWIEKNKCKEIVPILNKAMREGNYNDGIFETHCGANLEDLWKEYIEDVKGKKNTENP